MIRLIFTQLWPVFVPLILYVLWMFWRRRTARKNDDYVPDWMEGPWIWAAVASLLLLIASFFVLGLSYESDTGMSYQPKQMKDGVLMDERFD